MQVTKLAEVNLTATIKICERCGKEFTHKRNGEGAGRRFCSFNCYRPHRGKEDRTCPTCGKVFQVYHSDLQKHCSVWCVRPHNGNGEREVILPKAQIAPTEAFGYWLSGFIDGEATFVIIRQNPGGRARKRYLQPRFQIGQRDDDESLMRWIRDELGTGRVLTRARANKGSKPQTELSLVSNNDQLALIQILDRFPLRTRKRRSYEIWREAVLEKARPDGCDWEKMERLSQAIRKANSYNNGEVQDGT